MGGVTVGSRLSATVRYTLRTLAKLDEKICCRRREVTTDIKDIINCGGVSGSDFRGIGEMDIDDLLILIQEVKFRAGAGELSDVLQVVETVVTNNLQKKADELCEKADELCWLEARLEVLEEKNSELIDTLSNIRNELENMLDVHKTIFTELTYKINDVIRENE